jgi:hypothetical protein
LESSAQQLKIELTQLDTTLTDMHSQIDRALEDLNGSYAQPADYVPAIYTKYVVIFTQSRAGQLTSFQTPRLVVATKRILAPVNDQHHEAIRSVHDQTLPTSQPRERAVKST